MKVLIVGADAKGAFQMRGEQLGHAIGARVTLRPTATDWRWAEIVVLVKRAAMAWGHEARCLSVPVVWDVLDFWAQPAENQQPREYFLGLIARTRKFAGVGTLIGATRAMADDIGGVYVPHHARLGLTPRPIRDRAQIVAYDGQRKYLGRWQPALEQACQSLGLQFVANPPSVADADVLVSFRDGRWDGWVCRQWKSGVKQVNAVVAGRPMLAQESAAHVEIAPVCRTTDALCHLTESLERLTERDMREAAFEHGRSVGRMYHLDQVAQQYADVLKHAAVGCAA